MRELWFKTHFEVVDVFTTPSRFMIEHYVPLGPRPARIRHVSNGQTDYGAGHRDAPDPTRRRNRFGFFGQLVDNKGVHVILRRGHPAPRRGLHRLRRRAQRRQPPIRHRAASARKIEAFLAAEAQLPPNQQLVLLNGSYQVDQLASAHEPHRLVHRPLHLVGDLRPGDLRGLDVRQADPVLQCRRAEGADPA